MSNKLEEKDWDLLLRRIKDGKCTPFLGAGICAPTLPLGAEIAKVWAREYHYPLPDIGDLARVAQFLAVRYDPMFPKEELLKRFFLDCDSPDFNAANDPHGVLAELPLPVYMTTNYDDFMVQALRKHNKNPKRELCCWNSMVKNTPSVFTTNPTYVPTSADPIVFHLHGYDEVAESLVLTQDDYLDFLVNIARDQELLPHNIQRALTGSSLLFIGYSLDDWSFRVLFRGLITATEPSLRRISVTVQLPPANNAPEADQESVQRYLDAYFDRIDVRVYWGTAREFVAELRQRWKEFIHDG